MKRLRAIQESLIAQVQAQLGNLECVDTKELGEVIDMIKDIDETIYYCTITKAMNEADEHSKYYIEPKYRPPYYNRDMDKRYGKMYYNESYDMNEHEYQPYNNNNFNWDDHYQWELPYYERDYREGKSGVTRKNYMENKEMHKDKSIQLKELEKYVQELGQDITEMIEGASQEEKQLLQQKISTLASKIK